MIIDFDGLSLDELCGSIYVDAQVYVEQSTEGSDYNWNTFTSTYVDGDIYIDTPDGKFKAEGKFGEYLEQRLIQRTKQ